MNIVILGAAGFIGTNLTIALSKEKNDDGSLKNNITTFDRNNKRINSSNINNITGEFNLDTDFNTLLRNQDVVYHLISTTVPSTSNKDIAEEMKSNVIVTIRLLDACVKNRVKKVVFLSSGGTVYGINNDLPIREDSSTNPISTYGVQKLTIEKLLYLYNYLYGLDYRVIRLANPYGPYQKTNGVQGVVGTFIYKALKRETISVYGDGSVVRDFIYIDDAIRGIIKIANSNNNEIKVFNLGSGQGTSIKELLNIIENTLDIRLSIEYLPKRNVDINENYLSINAYESIFGRLNYVSLAKGIKETARFICGRM